MQVCKNSYSDFMVVICEMIYFLEDYVAVDEEELLR